MMTRAQAAAQKRAIRRDIDRDLKAKDRAKVRDLGAELRDARAKRNAAMAQASARCRAQRLEVRARIDDARAQNAAAMRAFVADERLGAKSACELGRNAATSETVPVVERARVQLDAERAHQAELKRIAAGNRKPRAGAPKASTRERRSESDDEVRANIAPDLVPLFDKVRRQIKATPRASRTEVFLEYAEAHPGELLAILDDETDALVRELEAQQERAYRASQKRAPGPKKAPAAKRASGAARIANPRGSVRAGDPSRVLTRMGGLVALEYQPTPHGTIYTLPFPKRRRPHLAYDPDGNLVIAYPMSARLRLSSAEAKRVDDEIDAARKRYRYSHFGSKGDADTLFNADAADPSGPSAALGELVNIVYETTKAGDPPDSEYGHPFLPELPILAKDRAGRLLILGGTYRITWRGIVG